ncbi:glucan phosphoethanolaminetransferase (alkaline phosphatase superfamily) [Alkalihalobacillus xiaoxiensis]|uniref:Glucan phosphoethanolaminetransferase (Alkaline phosphatase superfamily) n=1 Tax=Shouchella xiaoxiensis TaxID=766895 RepID=A0ABS2SRT1_9BACI|nr:hypothetical protein [Shouchella xiaoxiensis]MBM7837871.1 glucan phosphoethanolaminetransferase (alkaline phosphatase superfamily) [Shouchella xiaoxiensis]
MVSKNKKENPPLFGFSIVVTFLLWGILAFYAPIYLDIDREGILLTFRIVGFVLIFMSLIGSLIEISNLIKSEAFSYWGVSLVFIVPAVLLDFFINHYEVLSSWEFLIRIFIIVLFFIGLPFIPVGFVYLLNGGMKENRKITNEEEKEEQKSRKLQLAISLIVAIISLLTAIIQLFFSLN